MTTTTVCRSSKHIDLPCIHKVAWYAPLAWLQAGSQDFRTYWLQSLGYGVLFAALGYALVHASWTSPHLAMTLTTGFLLVAPFLALAFYELSQRRELAARGGRIGTWFGSARQNLASIGLLAVVLAIMLSAWERLSAIIVGIHLGTARVPDASLAWLFSGDNQAFILAFVAAGAVMAAIVFAISVVSIPMLMDRQVDVVTAIMTSLAAVRENPAAMLLWAALITGLSGLGVATDFVGLAVIFPILGHATWHAYRGLVSR